MKTLLLLWALPIAILGAWYGLSYYDLSFGYGYGNLRMLDAKEATARVAAGAPMRAAISA